MLETNAIWIDVSVPLGDDLTTFPNTPAVRTLRVSDIARGDPATVTDLRMSTHSGTHVDAPLHFLADSAAVDELDLDRLNGPARVIDLPHTTRLGAAELAEHDIKRGERILFRTRNSHTAWYREPFDPGYAHLAADGARHLVECGVVAVGIDYLSIGGEGQDNEETHRVLLGAGTASIEGLDLADVRGGDYELRCLPLRVAGADGAPARVLLRKTQP